MILIEQFMSTKAKYGNFLTSFVEKFNHTYLVLTNTSVFVQ